MNVKRYTAGFLFNEDRDRVLLINKLRPNWQRGYWNAIGGKIEDGETPINCMYREFAEECSIGGSMMSWSDGWEQFAVIHGNNAEHPDKDPWEVHFFMAFYFKKLQQYHNYGLTDERVMAFSVDNIPPNVIPNIKYLMQMALIRGVYYDSKFRIIEEKDL